jgi:predicted permease
VHVPRSLRHAPALAAGIVITISVAVAGNVASLAVIDRLLLRAPAGVEDSRSLRRLYVRRQIWNRAAFVSDNFSYPDFQDLARVAGPTRVVAYTSSPDRFNRESGRRASISFVSAGFLESVSSRPYRGRLLSLREDVPGRDANEAVISYEFWQTALGADSGILGRRLTFDNLAVVVVGIASKDFVGIDLDRIDAWLPLALRQRGREAPWWTNRDAQFLSVIARVRPGENALAARLTTEYRRVHADDVAGDPQATMLLAPLATARGPGELLPLEARNFSLAKRLSAISFAVLLVAGVNCASLLLLWAIQRRQEIGVRLAIGLSPPRLVVKLVTELVVLAMAAAIVAVLLAAWGSTILQASLLSTVRAEPAALDYRGALAAITLAVVAVIAAGIGPLLFLLRTQTAEAVNAAAGSENARDSRLRGIAIVGQMALSLALVSLAAVFLVTVRSDLRTGLKYDPQRLITVAATGQTPSRIAELLTRVRAMPFVEAATRSLAELPPGRAMIRFAPGVAEGTERALISFNAIDTGYFRTIGLALIAGRAFTRDDRAGQESVVILSDATARSFWPGQDPLGRCVHLNGQVCTRVVGVVPDVRWDLARPPMRHLYVPLEQAGRVGQIVQIRTRGRATAAHLVELERILSAADSAGNTPNIYLVASRMERQLQPLRVASTVLLLYALIVFVSAIVGTYGRVHFEITRRKRELGVRAALGASPTDLVMLVVRSGVRLVALGLALGIVLVALTGGVMARFVYGASADEPGILATMVAAFFVSGLVAMIVAARRVVLLSPIAALRVD